VDEMENLIMEQQQTKPTGELYTRKATGGGGEMQEVMDR
jgi:hypothetical protein